MKILNATQIKALDGYTMMHEPVTSDALMERAGYRLFLNIISKFPEFIHVVVFCGPGNNGGDGLVLARHFSLAGKAVEVIILKGNYTETFSKNFRRIQEEKIHYTILESLTEINSLDLSSKGIIIDALFGIGLNRPLEGLAAALVHKLNNITNYKIAIDIPSGLSADCSFKSTIENTIRVDHTLSIQLPKLAFMFAENEIFVGDFECVDISLDENYIEQEESPFYFTELIDITALIKPRSRHGFKGSFGHCLIMAGSEGKSGAAILASKAALKSGCGLVTACIPENAVIPMLSNLPEALIKSGVEEERFNEIDFSPFDALGFGPGIGLGIESSNVLLQLLKSFAKPMVIDADGITLLSRNKDWYGLLNPNIILTPHPGEFDRLTHKHNSGYERFKKQLEFSKNYNVNILLKGHYTSITTPSGAAYFNSTGNNGMATAGSGDVLTGIISSLLAQGHSPTHATSMGAYLHGFARDSAALENSKTSMIASDIINGIPAFFKQFE